MRILLHGLCPAALIRQPRPFFANINRVELIQKARRSEPVKSIFTVTNGPSPGTRTPHHKTTIRVMHSYPMS